MATQRAAPKSPTSQQPSATTRITSRTTQLTATMQGGKLTSVTGNLNQAVTTHEIDLVIAVLGDNIRHLMEAP